MSESLNHRILGLVTDVGFLTESAQLQAKALIYELTKQTPAYRWTYISNRMIRNLTFASLQLEKLARQDHVLTQEVEAAARKVALIWESLAVLEDGTSRETALINAAVNFELAGYQANAMSLAKGMMQSGNYTEDLSVPELVALFLQRRFVRLRHVASILKQEPPADVIGPELLEAFGKAITASALSEALRFFLRGDVHSLRNADEILDEALELFTSLQIVQESNLLNSIKTLLPMMAKRSTWTNLSALAVQNQPRWQRYLKLLARGVSEDVFLARSVSELWFSQLVAIQNGLLDLASSKVVKMPTSAGKTRIAELAIIYTLVNNPLAKCIYVAPYRALVSEVEQSFLSILHDLGFHVSSTQGVSEDYSVSNFEEELFKDTDVLVTTPEKLDLLLRARPEFLDKVSLFVLDEAHIVDDLNRGLKIEFLLTRLKRKLTNAHFLVLSAVVPQETLEDFAAWFNSDPAKDILTANWRPSIQRVAKFEWKGQSGVIRYSPDSEIPLLTQEEFVPGLVQTKKYSFRNPATNRLNHRTFPEPENKSQIAAELAFKFAELGPVLVFCPQANLVKSVAKALQDRINYTNLADEQLPSYFAQIGETRSAHLAQEWLGDSNITSFLKSGIGVHYGTLPENVRKAVEQDFRQKKYRIIVATNTLAQGVNLPIKTVIVHSARRYSQETSSWNRIPARDYWNIAGRAGRAGEETEGLIIHVTLTKDDELDYRYFLQRRDKVEPVESALFQKLRDLLNDRLSEEGFKNELDPEILGLLAEESDDRTSDQIIREFSFDALAHIQIERQTPELLDELENILLTTAHELALRVENRDTRKLFSMTGLSSTSCITVVEDLTNTADPVRHLLEKAGEDDLEKLIDTFLFSCTKLKEMQPRRDFSGSYSDLLRDWIRGVSVSDLLVEYAEYVSSPDELSLFIDDFIRYRLPWGIASYIRIAKSNLSLTSSQVSEYVQYFPAMVKFGVPTPSACWAMSLGIPSRKVAMQLGSTYDDETSTRTHRSFLEWLNTLTPERLQLEFGLEGFLLEDISRSLLLFSSNPLLKEYFDIKLLPLEVKIQGINYDNRDKVALRCHAGDDVAIERDYDSLLDRNALLVKWRNQDMGYLPRNVAEVLAVEVDSGIELAGVVTVVDKTKKVPEVHILISPIEGIN